MAENQQLAEDISGSESSTAGKEDNKSSRCYSIQFRGDRQVFSAASRVLNLRPADLVMVQTDHGLEPARIMTVGPYWPLPGDPKLITSFALVRKCNRDEEEKYDRLIDREREAFELCQQRIRKYDLVMKLIKVERYFNGSKIIFYFTAETRVDFRELVKDLVQEFRTRVEMRQVGVRHESKMIGGIGCCGRELCCSSYMRKFMPVSIKMAKEQGLPLNPGKISGICNRLLCCLTYEYKAYRAVRKHMPKPGKNIKLQGRTLKVVQYNVLKETVTVTDPESPGKTQILSREEWENASPQEGKK